jgi:hypothetical protein
MDDFKEESNSTAREAAASIGGVEDALSAVQEVAANALAGFGPAGAAAGLAAATGIGLLFSGLQASADKANEAKDKVIGLAATISEAGGNMAKVDFAGMMRAWSDEIANNKSWWEIWQKDNTTNLEVVKQKADEAGLSFHDMYLAMQGDDPQAVSKVLDEINRRLDENTAARDRATLATLGNVQETAYNVTAIDLERKSLLDNKDALIAKAGQTEEAIARAALMAEGAGKTAEAEKLAAEAVTARADAYKSAMESIGGASDDIEDANTRATKAEEERAKAEEARLQKSGDKWQDYAAKVLGSIDDVIAAQEKDLQAQLDFQANTEEVFASVGQAGVDWANAQGENAERAMQLLADAPLAKQSEVAANFAAAGAAATAGYAGGIERKGPVVDRAAREVWTGARNIFRQGVNIPVGVRGPSTADMRMTQQAVQSWFLFHPVKVKVTPMSGTGYGVVI